jgi:hypothetical protein
MHLVFHPSIQLMLFEPQIILGLVLAAGTTGESEMVFALSGLCPVTL